MHSPFSLRTMPTHTAENVKELSSRLRRAVDLAQDEYQRYRASTLPARELANAAVA